jgi:hypothetical protein
MYDSDRRGNGYVRRASQDGDEDARPKLPEVADAFQEGEGLLPSNPLIVAGLEAMYKGGPEVRSLARGWRRSETGRPVYSQFSREGARIIVYPNLTKDPSHPLPTPTSEWEFVQGLSAFTSDVALAVLAQLCEPISGDQPKDPLNDSVRITAEAILRYKGIQRLGKQREDLYARVSEEMDRLQAIRFDVEKHSEEGEGESRGTSWREDRLFDIVQVEQWRERRGTRERVDVVWLVRAGQWAAWWLNPQGRLWISRMARLLLELDHRDTRGADLVAKKIGQRVVLANDAIRHPGPIPIRIDQLLERIGELPVEQDRSKHWAGRTRDRFDEAMLMLREAGVFSDVRWPDGYGPGESDRSRGWVARWLSAKVLLWLPQSAPDPLPGQRALELVWPSPSQRGSGSFELEPQNLGTILRARLGERYVSQKALARYLGISNSYLSMILKGDRTPSAAVMTAIKGWLADES